jgi:hypothetical protein
MDARPQPVQFSLRQLLGAMLAVALAIGLFRVEPVLLWVALWIVYAAMVLAVAARATSSESGLWVCAALIILPLAIVAFLLIPAVRR